MTMPRDDWALRPWQDDAWGPMWPRDQFFQEFRDLWPRWFGYNAFRRPFEVTRRMMDSLANDSEWRNMITGGDIELTDREFAMKVDVSGFEPKDLVVKVDSGFLNVEGRHEEKSDDGSRYVSRQFSRRYKLPPNANQEALKSALVQDGRQLRISAPLLAVESPKEQTIPIEYVK